MSYPMNKDNDDTWIDGPVVATVSEWASLTEEQKQFLREAESVHMFYQIENGEVCAWGYCMAEFTMSVKIEKHPFDGNLVTLKSRE